MTICKQCLISDAVSGVIINNSGICEYCYNYNPSNNIREEESRKEREADLEKTIQNCKGHAEYDCLVPVSGGKDSIFLLHKLKVEYGLKILAFTTDISIPPIAWDNMVRTMNALEIDHVIYRPSDKFYQKLFRYLLKNQEQRGAVYSVSYVYAPLFEGDAIKLAIEKNIPLILAGYSPGQPEPDRMMYEFSRRLIEQVDWTPPGLKYCNEFDEQQLSRFFNPLNYPQNTEFPRYLAPYHAWAYNQEEVMHKVVELGLVKSAKHASPVFSNYPINWLLMYSDLKHFGYNPYLPEFAELIREGKANKQQWRLIIPLVDFMVKNKVFLGKEIKNSLKWLELSEDELCINQPQGVYDPPL